MSLSSQQKSTSRIMEAWICRDECPERIVEAVENGDIPEWVKGYDVPIVRGGTESQMHSPALASSDPDKACWRGHLANARPAEYEQLQIWKDECGCPECATFFEAVRDVLKGPDGPHPDVETDRMGGMVIEQQPAWVQEYENPVIEVAAGSRHKNIHAPDRTAADPRPACVGRGLPETDWIAKELNGGLAAFRQPCSSDECLQELARTARGLQARFDG